MSANRLAPEWERQDAIIIVWPHLHSDWTRHLAVIEKTYLELSKHICRHQRLIVVAYDEAHLLHIREKLNHSSVHTGNVTYVTIATNDTWVRDYGPVYISSNNDLSILDFKFDAWGQKYNYARDNAFNTKLIEQLNLNISYKPIDQVLEAGNIEVNNKGELLCSISCLNRNNNESVTHVSQLEEKFSDWFGINKTYWIDEVQLKGDDTDGHIDTLARFCTDDIIAYSATGKQSDVNNEALNQLAIQLKSICKQSNNRIGLAPLPLPKPIFLSAKQLPATYINFLITNETVLVPVFNDQQDNNALKLIDELFPSRQIIDIASSTLIQQFGGIHCATMQVPRGAMK